MRARCVARVVTAWGCGVVRARGSVGLLSKHLQVGDASQAWILARRCSFAGGAVGAVGVVEI